MYAVFDGFEGLVNNQVRFDAFLSLSESQDGLKLLGEKSELDVGQRLGQCWRFFTRLSKVI